MNILMVTNTFTPIVGGVERSIRSFCEEFRNLGHRVLIVTLEFDGMPEHETDVIRIPAIRHFNGSDFSVRLPVPVDLSVRIEAFAPDIVHAHHPFMLGDTALRIANMYRIPLVFTHHTRYEDYTHYVPLDSPLLKKFVVELTTGYAALADQVIAPSRSIYDLLRERGVRTPIEIIPTGVHVDRFVPDGRQTGRREWGIAADEFIVGTVGRLAPEKNLMFLCRSVAHFLHRRSRARFMVIGSGPLREEIRKFFVRERLGDRLLLCGVLGGGKLREAYQAMDVFAFSSHTETQGMVLLEAMAAAVPVVALDASGVRDTVEDGVTGRVLAVEDVGEFSAAISWYDRQSPERKERLRQNAVAAAGRCSIQETARKTIALYQAQLRKNFVYCDIENSHWAKAVGQIQAEWELVSNLVEAVGAVFSKRFTGPVREKLTQRLRRWLSSHEWTARLVDLSRSEGTATAPGIVLIQIDGLSLPQIRKALRSGRMPFLHQLLKRERYDLSEWYSGQPSSTPGVQAELFYGVKGAVPSFSFMDSRSREIFRMYDERAAAAVETLLSRNNAGLLEAGSSYANVYSGGARQTHFCAVDFGVDTLWKNINPFRIAALAAIHWFSVLKIVRNLVLEFISAVWDFFRGIAGGQPLRKEFKFILARLGIGVLLRDLCTFGVRLDIVRGVEIIHVNFLGYDEHAHRRGPDSRFALHTLRGIDRSIRQIYRQTLRASRRNYDVWIYSDHGQETVRSYAREYKKSVQQAVREVFQGFFSAPADPSFSEERGVQVHRARYLGAGLFRRLSPAYSSFRRPASARRLVVTAMGPVGHIYLPRAVSGAEKERFARQLIEHAHIPMVLSADSAAETVTAWNEQGTFYLPQDAARILGPLHPHLTEVTEDLMRTCRRQDAGDFMICGWVPDGIPWSFPLESGAHGGPGIRETSGFALLPADIRSRIKADSCLRPLDVRTQAMRFLRRRPNAIRAEVFSIVPPVVSSIRTVRIMTYNVHGCKGMDNKISPERISRIISRYEPDIVALQELDMRRRRSGNIDQPHEIANALEMQYHFHPCITVEEQQYGNAVLSRFPLKLMRAGQLPVGGAYASAEPRGVLWTAVDLDGMSMQFLTTHFGLSAGERKVQTTALMGPAWLAHPECRHPVVLVGDFNAPPNSDTCRAVKTALQDAQEALAGHVPKATWAGCLPLRRIDHVFVSQEITVTQVMVPGTRLEKIASDHLPLIVDIEISLNDERGQSNNAGVQDGTGTVGNEIADGEAVPGRVRAGVAIS